MQTATHDQVSKLFQALLADAGWDDVKEEDKWWDTDALGPGWGHRRPEVRFVCDGMVVSIKVIHFAYI